MNDGLFVLRELRLDGDMNQVEKSKSNSDTRIERITAGFCGLIRVAPEFLPGSDVSGCFRLFPINPYEAVSCSFFGFDGDV